MMTEPTNDYQTQVGTFAEDVGLPFANLDLLMQAFTHRSYLNEHDDPALVDNERLEFLGDAVLDFLSGEMLFRRFPDLPEGDLTRLRSALVRTESLALIAEDINLGELLRMSKGEEANGGRQRPPILCGSFEAMIGALYLDQGLAAVREFVLPRLDERLAIIQAEQLDKDARSILQEISQAEYGFTPTYRFVSATGPEHEKTFTFEALIGETVVGVGVGRSKQAAAHTAARDALRRLRAGEVTLARVRSDEDANS